MKAAIVTFVRAYNYGAILQCYALSKTLKDLGVDVKVIDYYPQYFKDMYNLSYLGELRYLPYRPLSNWLKFSAVLHTLNKRNSGFEKFICNNIPITKEQYSDFEDLNEKELPFDLYLSGSDQVWNNICVPFDPTYFLQFASALDKYRCSYAASFGFSEVPPKMESEYKKRLTGWNLYSVREQSGVELIRQLVDEEAYVCCDPTLLLTASEWKKVIQKTKKESPYILIYTVNEIKDLSLYAQKLSVQKNLPVYVLSTKMDHMSMMGYAERKMCFRTYGSASPEDWLSLFSNAKYVLSDSFHGTVFSLIFHKQFLTATNFERGKNNRAIELLTSMDLCSKFQFEDVDEIDRMIDWDRIDNSIALLRSSAMKYIENIMLLGESNAG